MEKYDDCRFPAKERAEAYVKELTVKEKIAQLFISDSENGEISIRRSYDI